MIRKKPPTTRYQRYEIDPAKKRNTFTSAELEELKFVDRHIDRIAREMGFYHVKHDPGVEPDDAALTAQAYRRKYRKEHSEHIREQSREYREKTKAAREQKEESK